MQIHLGQDLLRSLATASCLCVPVLVDNLEGWCPRVLVCTNLPHCSYWQHGLQMAGLRSDDAAGLGFYVLILVLVVSGTSCVVFRS